MSRVLEERVRRILRAGGIENAHQEARWIVAEAVARSDAGDVDGAESAAEGWAARRATGEPLQYVLGEAHFRHLKLEVGPGVFIPRPETESVAGRAIELLPQRGRAVDLGTGSGAIALSLATERPDAEVHATEASAEALAWARRNNAGTGEPLAGLWAGDLFAPLPEALRGELDVVVSNPPYVAEEERDRLPSDVVDHEPHGALFAPHSGMSVIERIADEALERLAPGGYLVLEIGETQGAEVAGLLATKGYRDVAVDRDLGARDRIITARKAAPYDGVVDALEAGGVAIVPTDTVYGLAARPDRPSAVQRIFELKGRAREKALPVLVHSLTAARKIARLDERANVLASRYWPGPLTIVAPRRPTFGHDLGGEGSSVGVRIPEHRHLLRLLAATGPLAVTSANLSGQPPSATAAGAAASFGRGGFDGAIFEAGNGRGTPSTVVSLIGTPEVLRAGGLGAEELWGVLRAAGYD